MTRAYVCMKLSEYPPPPPPGKRELVILPVESESVKSSRDGPISCVPESINPQSQHKKQFEEVTCSV